MYLQRDQLSKVSVFFLVDIQVALLSQRGRAMLHVLAYFAKSLKLIRNDTVE